MIDDVLAILDEYGIDYVEDGYKSLPTSHCFATWRKAHRRAEGADGFALYWDVTYEIRIFYRGGKSSADAVVEKEIEQAFRVLDNLESDYDCNDKDKLDVTFYTFDLREDF